MFWLIVLLTSVINRLSGMDRLWKNNGRNIYYTAPLLAVLCFVITRDAWYGLAVLAAFWAYRLPGWYDLMDIGHDAGNPVKEFFLFAVRQAFVLPFLVLRVVLCGNPVGTYLGIGLVSCLAASASYALAFWTVHRGLYRQRCLICRPPLAEPIVQVDGTSAVGWRYHMIEAMKGWRTVAFNVAMGGVAGLTLLGKLSPNQTPSEMQVHQIIDAAQGVVDGIWMAGNVALRAITNTPIFKKIHPAQATLERNGMTAPVFQPDTRTA